MQVHMHAYLCRCWPAATWVCGMWDGDTCLRLTHLRGVGQGTCKCAYVSKPLLASSNLGVWDVGWRHMLEIDTLARCRSRHMQVRVRVYAAAGQQQPGCVKADASAHARVSVPLLASSNLGVWDVGWRHVLGINTLARCARVPWVHVLVQLHICATGGPPGCAWDAGLSIEIQARQLQVTVMQVHWYCSILRQILKLNNIRKQHTRTPTPTPIPTPTPTPTHPHPHPHIHTHTHTPAWVVRQVRECYCVLDLGPVRQSLGDRPCSLPIVACCWMLLLLLLLGGCTGVATGRGCVGVTPPDMHLHVHARRVVSVPLAALHRAQEHEQYFRWLTCRNCAVQQALLLPPHKRGKQTRSSSMTVPFARGVRVLHPAMYRCDTKDILQHILAKAGMGIYHCGHGSAQALNLL
eukprot:1161623-Pelagomonas_calceolata.AAC.6